MRSALLPCLRGYLLCSLTGLSACATTSGQSWVREPVDVNSDTDAAFAARELEPMPEPVTLASAAAEGSAPTAANEGARPRLSHVISLGQNESGSSPTAVAAGPGAQPGVVVNIVNYGSTPYASGYYGYGYGYAPIYRAARGAPPSASTLPSGGTASTRSGGTPTLGGDWGPAPSYGPTFPWRTAPASPWGHSR